MTIFPISGNIGKENVFGDILERKVSTVNPWFVSKNGDFSNFFFYVI